MIKVTLFVAILLFGVFIYQNPIVLAVCPPDCTTVEKEKDKTTAPSTVKLPNPLGDGTTVPSLIGRVINAALGVVGSLALLMFVYGGFTWMLSGGNSQAVEKGKNILIWATLGLVIIFISYALVNFIIETAT